MPVSADHPLWESLARNTRFLAWLEMETGRYTEALVMMVDESQLRILQGRLRQLRDIRALCDAASRP